MALGLAFTSNSYAYTDAEMRAYTNVDGYIPSNAELNSFCGANNYAGGGFAHSTVIVMIQTYYRKGVFGDYIYIKNQKTGEYENTGIKDNSDNNMNIIERLSEVLNLNKSLDYSEEVRVYANKIIRSSGDYAVGSQYYEPGTNFCYSNPVTESAVVTQINTKISNDLMSQNPNIVEPAEVGYANYPEDGYVEIAKVLYNQTCTVKQEIYSGNNIYLSPGDNKSWTATRLNKIYHAFGPGNISKLYTFTNAGAVKDSDNFFANEYNPAILGMYKIEAGGVSPLYSSELPTCVSPVQVSIQLNCDSGYTTDGKTGGNTTYQSGNISYYQGNGKIFIRSNSNGKAKEFDSNSFDALSKEDKENLLNTYGTDLTNKQSCLLAQPDTTEPTEPEQPIYVPEQFASDTVYCPAGFSNDGTESGGITVGKGSIQIYTYAGQEYARNNRTGGYSTYSVSDFYNSQSKKEDVDRFGAWEETPKACLYIQKTEPTNPTDPTPPAPMPAFAFNNPVFINCAFGDTVGGVVGGQSYRSGSIDFYGQWIAERNAYIYYTKKGTEFTEVPMTSNGDGSSSFPSYTANDVDSFGKWNSGSEQACATPIVLPVDPTPPITEPTPVATPAYSFDLQYDEYCNYGDTVGGVTGGKTSRTGKLPVYWLFDSITYQTKYYFFDGVNYSEIQMTTINGISYFPVITKEMAKKYGSMSTDSIEECRAAPKPPFVQPAPQEGWDDIGIEQCAVGSTVGGIANGLTERKGSVSIWWTIDEFANDVYFFKSAKTGELTQFNYDDYPEYQAPDWAFSQGVINQYGAWNSDSVQACAPVRTFIDTVEVKTENCVSPLTGTITSERHYNLWNDGAKDSYGAWSVTSNNCVTPAEPPVTTPVEPTPPVDPVPPVTTPTDPTPPVTTPTEPVPDFTVQTEYQTSVEMCALGQTGKKTYRETWTYKEYTDGRKSDLTYVSRELVTNTCEDIKDDIIETEDGEQNESCPNGTLGTVTVKGQWVTRALSGKTFVETSRVENCIADIDDYVTETQTADCPSGQTGSIIKTRIRAIKTDGTSVYPFGEDYKTAENTCASLGIGDSSNVGIVSSAKGLLRNQTVRAEDTAQIQIMTNYINTVNIESDGDYKLNIIASNLSTKLIDSAKIGSLVNAWTTKTKGVVNFAGMPQSASAFIGQGPITAKNAKEIIIVSSKLNKQTGSITVTYKETPKGTVEGKSGTFEIPLVNIASAGKGLGYVIFGGKKLMD